MFLHPLSALTPVVCSLRRSAILDLLILFRLFLFLPFVPGCGTQASAYGARRSPGRPPARAAAPVKFGFECCPGAIPTARSSEQCRHGQAAASFVFLKHRCCYCFLLESILIQAKTESTSQNTMRSKSDFCNNYFVDEHDDQIYVFDFNCWTAHRAPTTTTGSYYKHPFFCLPRRAISMTEEFPVS